MDGMVVHTGAISAHRERRKDPIFRVVVAHQKSHHQTSCRRRDVNDVCPPEDHGKLKKLEVKLAELKLVTAPKLEIICHPSLLAHLGEPLKMNLLPPPPDGNEIDVVAGSQGVGGQGECTIVSSRKFDESRAEKRHGECYQAIPLYRLFVDVGLAIFLRKLDINGRIANALRFACTLSHYSVPQRPKIRFG